VGFGVELLGRAPLAEPPTSCNRVACVHRKVCQLTQGVPILRPVGFKSRNGKVSEGGNANVKIGYDPLL
jgi:hypothetical protein